MKSSVVNIATPSSMADTSNVDVTPVMNLFIILIPFLVSMAVFSQLSVLQFSLPAEGDRGRISEVAALPLTLTMSTGELILLRGDATLTSLPLREGAHDLASLAAALRVLDTGPVDGELTLAVHDGVRFDDMVACMDVCREAGFFALSLAEGTRPCPTNNGAAQTSPPSDNQTESRNAAPASNTGGSGDATH